jgi:hypothetical protein
MEIVKHTEQQVQLDIANSPVKFSKERKWQVEWETIMSLNTARKLCQSILIELCFIFKEMFQVAMTLLSEYVMLSKRTKNKYGIYNTPLS